MAPTSKGGARVKNRSTTRKAWKRLTIISCFLLLSIFLVQSKTLSAPPYTYNFTPDNREVFNSIGTLNKMEIEFDYNIIPYSFTTTPPVISSSPGIIAGAEATNNKLTVYFRNLDIRSSFLDYSCLFTGSCHYEIEIPAGSLTPMTDSSPAFPLEPYKIPFSMLDILPGFKTTFLDSNPITINQFVFKDNPPREIMIEVPNIFMTQIETIHRYSGLDPSGNLKPLTNIDIIALAQVERINLEYGFGSNTQFSRLLERKNVNGFNGFTTGQAGLEAYDFGEGSQLNPDHRQVDEIRLDAFNKHGRYLETRSFKLRVKDKTNEFRINDYIGPIPNHFGETYSLYNLMEDEELLEQVIKQMPVSQLDRLSVKYANRINSRKVSTYEQLLNALRDFNVTTIHLQDDIQAPQGSPSLVVDRNVTIFGEGHRLGVGNVRLGTGSNQIIALRDLAIDHPSIFSNVTVDVGTSGTLIAEGLTVDGDVTVKSGGSNSLYFHNVNLVNLEIDAIHPVRMVVSGDSVIDPSKNRGIYVKGSGRHVLDIHSNDIRVKVAKAGYVRRLNSYGTGLFLDNNNGGTVEEIHGRGTPHITFQHPTTGVAHVSAAKEDWERGKRLMIPEITLDNGTKMYFGQANIKWEKVDDSFAPDTAHWNKETNYLTISGTNANSGTIKFEGRNTAGQSTQFIVELSVTIY